MSGFRKQTMILAVLILLIACAAWYGKKFNDTAVNEAGVTASKTSETKQSSTSFFAESRMSRENERNAEKQELDKIAGSKDASKDAKTAANMQKMELLGRGDKENKIESLVKGEGFDDALCYIDDKGVEVCVKVTSNLTEEQANHIKDIVVRTTQIKPSNIVIKPQH